MAKLKVLTYPDPFLYKKAHAVQEFGEKLDRIISDMLETMYVEEGCGLAAPQVGLDLRMMVIDVSKEKKQPQVFINPVITKTEGSCTDSEGCLSVPGYRETVKRAKVITVEAFDAKGQKFEVTADGLLSRCIQHECDHLDGILYVDRVSNLKKHLFKKWFSKHTFE